MPILKVIKQHKVLFDTHVFLWYIGSNKRLSKKFMQDLQHVKDTHPILVSAMTFLEIGMLYQKGKIKLEMDCLDWVERSLTDPDIEIAQMTPEIAVQSTCLPGILHGDPIDRILIATAIHHHAVLVTADEKILEYAKDSVLVAFEP